MAKLDMKLLIHRPDHRVLFAEAGKPVIDFLFNLLSLPLASVVAFLTDTPEDSPGCLKNLYGSVQDLNDTYIEPFQTKDSLLNPKVHVSGTLDPLSLPSIETSRSKEFYICEADKYVHCRAQVAGEPKAKCPWCRSNMNRKATYSYIEGEKEREEGGYVKDTVTYMVMDDLSVEPMSAISSIAILNKFKIQNVGDLEEKVVTLNAIEGLKLLKAALECKTVLTNVFLGSRPITVM